MVNNVCMSCGKYVFDSQNVNAFKRMTAEEYVECVLRNRLRSNKPAAVILSHLGLQDKWVVNQSCCELCGAPHGIWTLPNEQPANVLCIRYFYSGGETPTEKDKRFVQEFKSRFFSR